MVNLPSKWFDHKVTEVTKRLTAAYESYKKINPSYGVGEKTGADYGFVFEQKTFNEFTRQICEEYFKNIYTKRGISKTIKDKIKGDFLTAMINALEESKNSERMKILLAEFRKLQ